MNTLLILLLAILAGGLTALQGAFNANLGKLLTHPLQATLISFTVGTCGCLAAIMALKAGLPPLARLAMVPPYLFFGGLFGALFITATVLFIPKIGVASMLVATLLGQMLISLFLDHYGLFGLPVTAASFQRITGVALVIVGLYLVTFQPAR